MFCIIEVAANLRRRPRHFRLGRIAAQVVEALAEASVLAAKAETDGAVEPGESAKRQGFLVALVERWALDTAAWAVVARVPGKR